MRCFFALSPSMQMKLNIEHWRDTNLPKLTKNVVASNFHITSVFIGNINEIELVRLKEAMDEDYEKGKLALGNIQLTLNKVGIFHKPQVLWLGANTLPDNIFALEKRLKTTCQRVGLNLSHVAKAYKPHLTIMRKYKDLPPTPIIAPDFTCSFDEVTLYESISTSKGVLYQARASWPLHN